MTAFRTRLKTLLDGFAGGTTGRAAFERELTRLVTGEITTPSAVIDTAREARAGFAEAIYAAGKTPEQVVEIFTAMVREGGRALATRCSPETLALLGERVEGLGLESHAGLAWFPRRHRPGRGLVAVVAAGTSDQRVAEEAACTLAFAGFGVERIYDVGVAGIHRLFGRLPRLQKAEVVIVVAGMEGALPSVVGGLVPAPVIAVPTSVGYGASFHGVAALLGMLNSCSAGVTVVNIDNGFGAAVAAARILQRRPRRGG